MKIVLYSPNFYPLTGGLEQVVQDLATEFTRAGHQAEVITLTAASAPDHFSFRVWRKPGFFTQVRRMRASDVVLQFNVSLKGILPWLLAGKPLVISHQTPYGKDLRGRLKSWVSNHLARRNIGCSAYMAAPFRRAAVIPNPYDHRCFQNTVSWEARDRDLVFLGRLVSDKGVDLLLEALVLLRKKGLEPTLSIIGDGSELERLQQMVRAQGLENQVVFAGLLKGPALAAALNRHRVLVVPSRWNEPFGIVALEGLACGCAVVASAGGGLPEALGGFGLTFPNGDARALGDCLETFFTTAGRRHGEKPSVPPSRRGDLNQHLAKHRTTAVAESYLEVLQKCLQR